MSTEILILTHSHNYNYDSKSSSGNLKRLLAIMFSAWVNLWYSSSDSEIILSFLNMVSMNPSVQWQMSLHPSANLVWDYYYSNNCDFNLVKAFGGGEKRWSIFYHFIGKVYVLSTNFIKISYWCNVMDPHFLLFIVI